MTEENKVTISLEKYEEMKNKIERLERENLEKTIYKTHPVDWVIFSFLVLGMLMFMNYVR